VIGVLRMLEQNTINWVVYNHSNLFLTVLMAGECSINRKVLCLVTAHFLVHKWYLLTVTSCNGGIGGIFYGVTNTKQGNFLPGIPSQWVAEFQCMTVEGTPTLRLEQMVESQSLEAVNMLLYMEKQTLQM
jgi:hypothetical protein